MSFEKGSLPPGDFISPDHLLSAIVDSSDDAIVSKNLKGIVTSWNKGAQRIFGYTAEEMVGASITRLIPIDRQNEEPRILDILQKGERVDHFETQRLRKDGNIIEVSLCISPVKNIAGSIVGASKIARDITSQKRLSEQLRLAALEAETQSRMKDEFLATLSHELRTPLQAILGWTQILMTGPCEDQEIRQGLEVIDRNAHAQTRIIEDLLDMNRILSGKVRLDVQRVDLQSVIGEGVEALKPAAQAKKQRLHTLIDPLAPAVLGDPVRLQQIVWNLLSNAVKFTPSGGTITVALQRVNSHVEISITDSGAGIPADFLPHVFERFRQFDSSTTRRHGGLGLGLAIVRHLTELHGGTVRARSPGENAGSTFTVLLPLAVLHSEPDTSAHQHPASTRASSSSLTQPLLQQVSLLVVDDEEDARTMLAKTLSMAGAEVTTASSAPQALECLRAHVPHVIISDIGMPGQDGYDLMREIRSHSEEQGGQVPAIALTAYTRTEDRIKSIAAGFQMHLSKPADSVELITMVASLAGKRPMPPQSPEDSPQQVPS
ncbi:ATP-binding protein [Prosthecobacter sp.]|uniref:hybrid sensor histidine kinase/response regulator n=1 Tax=Prosthecobacter sp. TaxID=1965333 RepID=UPI0024887576|nr:ATP-binding protein [Prosthecobacter sp.]MDI1310675.1 ATP-binding protein [Prosthecobacter sp.]